MNRKQSVCHLCGDTIEPHAMLVEVFETTGRLVCEDCSEEAIETDYERACAELERGDHP